MGSPGGEQTGGEQKLSGEDEILGGGGASWSTFYPAGSLCDDVRGKCVKIVEILRKREVLDVLRYLAEKGWSLGEVR